MISSVAFLDGFPYGEIVEYKNYTSKVLYRPREEDKMKEKKSLFGDFAFYKSALAIAVPIMLQALIQNMVSLIDNFMVSGLGDISMSGVNVAGQILFVFMVFVNTITMAGGIFLTQFFGAKDKVGMQQAFIFKVLLGMSAFIPYFFVCRVFPRQVLSLMLIGNSQAPLILDEAVRYIRIMFWMGPLMTMSVSIASSLRDMGRVKAPLVVTVIATLTNTVFNYILIYGRFGFPALGVRSAAVATVIARTVEFLIFLGIYIKVKPEFAISLRGGFKVDFRLFGEILKKGALMLFCEMTWVISETVNTAIFNSRGGAEVVSGMSASFAIANLFFVAFGGIYSATSVMIGKTLGEGNLEKARDQKNWLLSGSIVFGCIMTLVGFVTIALVPVVFGRLSPEAVSITKRMVVVLALFMPVWVYINAQQAVARSGGDTKMGAVGDATVTLIILMPMILILGIYTSIGPIQLFIYIKLVDFIKVTIFYFWLKKERWLKNLAEGHAA